MEDFQKVIMLFVCLVQSSLISIPVLEKLGILSYNFARRISWFDCEVRRVGGFVETSVTFVPDRAVGLWLHLLLYFADCTFSKGNGGAEGQDFQSLFPSGNSRGNENVAN